MIKPKSLREHLTRAIPELRAQPDKLEVFIDEGGVLHRPGPGLSFEYRYTVNVVLLDFAASPDAVMVPLLVWLRRHQPDVFAEGGEKISFEADVLRNDLVDLSLKVPLTERVGVHKGVGGYHVEHYPEPDFEHADGLAEHWKVYLKDELIGEFDVPAAP